LGANASAAVGDANVSSRTLYGHGIQDLYHSVLHSIDCSQLECHQGRAICMHSWEIEAESHFSGS